MFTLFALEKTYFESFINFQNNLEKLRSMASVEVVEKVKFETLERIKNSDKKYGVLGNEAHIQIIGQLRETPEICASLFGGDQTLYPDIVRAISEAELDDEINKIIFNIDSPGGTVSGVDITAMAIKNAVKPTEARIHNLGASAAYWLASQADKIIAMTPTVEVGSIGVAAEIIDISKSDEQRGIKRHMLTSTDAPDKRPDISKKSGRNKIVNRLDDIHNVFVSRISEGRKISIEDINKNFGKGGVVIAENALKVGMIDEIKNSNKTKNMINIITRIKVIDKDTFIDINNNNKINNPPLIEGKNINKEVNSMNLVELKTNHPDLYDQILEEGVSSERLRVTQLLGWDATEEARKIAKGAIIEGKTQNDVLSQLTTASAFQKKADETAGENVQDLSLSNSVDNQIKDGKKDADIMPTKEQVLAYAGGV